MNKMLTILIISAYLLCGCTSQASSASQIITEMLSSEADFKNAAMVFELESGYERRAEKIDFAGFGGEITAASFYDNKLWFVSKTGLYNSSIDGSDMHEVFSSLPNNIQYIAFGSNGEIYLGTAHDIFVFAKDGTNISHITLEKMQILLDLDVLPDSSLIALIWIDGKYSICTLVNDVVGDEINLRFPENMDIVGILCYNGAVFLTVGDGISVYSRKESFPILKWRDIGVSSREAFVVGITDDRRILYLNRSDGNLYAIYDMPTRFEKKELSLAYISDIDWIPPELDIAVAQFNLSSNEYKINIVRYPSLELLNIQIISGDIPDIIEVGITGYIPFENCADKALFEDLSPFFEKDPEVALVPAIHHIMSTGENLFRISPGFMVMTLLGNSDFVGSEQGWTYEEIKRCLANAPEGATIFPAHWSQEAILTYLLYQNIDEFIDWKSGYALFNTQEFKDLLALIDTIPHNPSRLQDEMQLILDGRQLITHFTFSHFEDFVRFEENLMGKAAYKGFPSSMKYSGVLYPTYTLSMTSSCSDKDGAWSFIRSTLLVDDNNQLFPATQSKFDTAVNSAKTTPQFGTSPMTQAHYEKFMRFLDGIHTVYSRCFPVQLIIEEEVPAYFSGQKSAEDVILIIQSRAQTYVSEQFG